MTSITANEFADTMFAQIDPFCADIADQTLVSQSRCVDHLLDLYNATDCPALRQVITESLDDIRHLSAVGAGDYRMKMQLLAAAAAVEAAFMGSEV